MFSEMCFPISYGFWLKFRNLNTWLQQGKECNHGCMKLLFPWLRQNGKFGQCVSKRLPSITHIKQRKSNTSIFLVSSFGEKKLDKLEVLVSSDSSQRLTTNTHVKIEDTTLLIPKEMLKSAFSNGQRTADVQFLH